MLFRILRLLIPLVVTQQRLGDDMAINKVVYGDNTLIDLTADTVTADKLAQGYTAHDASGAAITGTMSGVGTNEEIFKKWTVTVDTDHSETGIYTFLTDSWIAQHYADSGLEIHISYVGTAPLDTAVCFIYTVARNTKFSDDHYQFPIRAKSGTPYVTAQVVAMADANLNTRCRLGTYSDGTVKIRHDSASVLLAGDYEVLARLL